MGLNEHTDVSQSKAYAGLLPAGRFSAVETREDFVDVRPRYAVASVTHRNFHAFDADRGFSSNINSASGIFYRVLHQICQNIEEVRPVGRYLQSGFNIIMKPDALA